MNRLTESERAHAAALQRLRGLAHNLETAPSMFRSRGALADLAEALHDIADDLGALEE